MYHKYSRTYIRGGEAQNPGRTAIYNVAADLLNETSNNEVDVNTILLSDFDHRLHECINEVCFSFARKQSFNGIA